MDFRTSVNSDKPLVTIGVLSYNYAAYVLDTLNTILAQTYPHIELFIVDDYSTDNSVALIKQWIAEHIVDVKLIVHEVNKGRNTAINTILEHAQGKYIALFASDDEMLPRRVEEQVNVLEQVGDEYALCYSDAELINEQSEPRGFYFEENNMPMLEGDVFEEYYHGSFRIPAPSIMFRRSIYDRVGFYDARLWAEDFDMFMRILPLAKVAKCDYVGVKYRIKENYTPSPSRSFELDEIYHKDRIIIYQKLVALLDSLNKYSNIKEAAIKKIGFHLIHLKKMKSPGFHKMLRHLLGSSFYNIPYRRLFKMQVRQMLAMNT